MTNLSVSSSSPSPTNDQTNMCIVYTSAMHLILICYVFGMGYYCGYSLAVVVDLNLE